MSLEKKLEPDLLIVNKPFKHTSTSALVLNSLFKNNPAKLTNAPELTPRLTPSTPTVELTHSTLNTLKPTKNDHFFNTNNIANKSERIGDLFSALASGNFADNSTLSVNTEEERRPNPATFFSMKNKLVPSPASQQRNNLDLEAAKKKEYEEELKRRSKNRLRK